MSRIHEALKRAEEEKLAAGVSSATIATASPVEPAVVADTVLPAPAGLMEPGSGPVAVATAVSQVPPAAEAAHPPLPACQQKSWNPEKLMLFLNSTSQNEAGLEEFRTLRSRLYQLRERRPLKTILIASAAPAEGKTFVAANLAQALARQHGRRTLLIDGDLRKPRLHECLGTNAAPGLSDFLRGVAEEWSIVQGGPMQDLFFVPGGNAVSNPAELVGSSRLKQFIASMGALFEWIIIDSPPVVMVSDAVLMASCCDGVLLVVEAATTPYEMAQKAIQELRGAPMLGVVLNRVHAGASYTSYYYDRYAHGKNKQERTAKAPR